MPFVDASILWYRVWSDGWIEQGGKATATAVTLHKAYKDTNYTITTSNRIIGDDYDWVQGIKTINTDSFIMAGSAGTFYWRTCGY